MLTIPRPAFPLTDTTPLTLRLTLSCFYSIHTSQNLARMIILFVVIVVVAAFAGFSWPLMFLLALVSTLFWGYDFSPFLPPFPVLSSTLHSTPCGTGLVWPVFIFVFIFIFFY